MIKICHITICENSLGAAIHWPRSDGVYPLPSLFLLFRMNTIGICLALFSEPTEGKGAGLRNTCDCPTAGSGRVRLLTLNASNPIDQGSDPPVPLLSRSLEFLKFLWVVLTPFHSWSCWWGPLASCRRRLTTAHFVLLCHHVSGPDPTLLSISDYQMEFLKWHMSLSDTTTMSVTCFQSLFGVVSNYECSPGIQWLYPPVAPLSSQRTPCPQFHPSLFPQAEYPMLLPRSRELTLIQSNYISCCYRV